MSFEFVLHFQPHCAFSYAAISASQALNHHFWLLQLCHCCCCCHAQRQGKLHEKDPGMKDTKGLQQGHQAHHEEPGEAHYEVHEGQEAHAGHKDHGGEGIQAFPQLQAQIRGVQSGHQVLQEGLSFMDLDPARHAAGEVPDVLHTMVEELPQAWCALAPVSSKTESFQGVVKEDAAAVVFSIAAPGALKTCSWNLSGTIDYDVVRCCLLICSLFSALGALKSFQHHSFHNQL